MLAPAVSALSFVPPIGLTLFGLFVGLLSAVTAGFGLWWIALGLFAFNRILDGLDGDVARATRKASDSGGYADITADMVVYAAIPIGASIGSDISNIWIFTTILLASFYINTITWSYLAAIIEKQARQGLETTSIVFPPGLVEGTETVLFYAAMLVLPQWLDWTMLSMSVAVMIGAIARFTTAQVQLRRAGQ